MISAVPSCSTRNSTSASRDPGSSSTERNRAARKSTTSAGEVSYSAPMGGSLVGSRVGEVVMASLPGGTRKLEIVSIELYD